MLRNFSLFVFYFILPYALIAQVEITGTVTDESLEPLIGVSLLIVDTSSGAITDSYGNFTLRLDSLPAKIEISYTGYTSLDTTLTQVKTYQFIIKEGGIDLSKVVVTGHPQWNYRTEWQELQESTPNLVRAIDYLKNDEGSSIQNTLNSVPGVFMHSGGLNTNRITIRGIGNRNLFGTAKIKAYFNEIPLTNGVGESSLEDFPLTPIQELNIVKGPNSSIYGAGLGGAIYLNSNSNYLGEDFLSIYTNNTFGSYGLMKNEIGFKSNSFQVGYSRLKQDGYRANNEYERHNFYLTGTWKLGKKHLLMPLLLHTNLKAFIPSSLNREDYENEPEKAAFTWGRVKGFEDYQRTLAGLSYNVKLNEVLQINASLYGTLFQSYESRPFNILEEKSNSFGGRALLSWNYLTNNSWEGQLRVGAESYQETYDWQTYATDLGTQGNLLSDNEEVRTTQNIFAQASLKNGAWDAKIGLSFNTINYDLEDNFKSDSLDFSGNYAFTPTLSPSISLSYQNTPLGKIYGIISHGFSPPTLEETFLPEGTINTDIQPEKGWNFELGIRREYSRLRYNISIYSMQIKDLLVARRTDFDQFIGINAGKSVHNGLELEMNYALREGYLWKVDGFLNYTYSDYKFKDFIDAGNDYSGNFLTGTAPHRLNAGIRWHEQRSSGFHGNINYQYVDAMPLRDDNSIYSESYHLTNAKIGYRKPFKPFNIDLFMGINNIFDMKYASMLLINAGSFGGAAPRYYYPGLPRNYYAGLKVDFQLK